jgi:hypothetical protein
MSQGPEQSGVIVPCKVTDPKPSVHARKHCAGRLWLVRATADKRLSCHASADKNDGRSLVVAVGQTHEHASTDACSNVSKQGGASTGPAPRASAFEEDGGWGRSINWGYALVKRPVAQSNTHVVSGCKRPFHVQEYRSTNHRRLHTSGQGVYKRLQGQRAQQGCTRCAPGIV